MAHSLKRSASRCSLAVASAKLRMENLTLRKISQRQSARGIEKALAMVSVRRWLVRVVVGSVHLARVICKRVFCGAALYNAAYITKQRHLYHE